MENCCFNKAIDCAEHGRKCGCCGWNPDVAVERVKEWEIKRRMENNTNG